MYSRHFLSEAGSNFIAFMRDFEARLAKTTQEKAADVRTSMYQVDPSLLPAITTRAITYVGSLVDVIDDEMIITVPDLVSLGTVKIGDNSITSWEHSQNTVTFSVAGIDYETSDITLLACTVGNSFVREYMEAHFPEAYQNIYERLWDTPLYVPGYEGLTRRDFYTSCRDFLFFSRTTERKASIRALLCITLGVPYSPLTGRVASNAYETVTVSTSGGETETVYIPVEYRPYLSVSDGDRVKFGQPLTDTVRVI